MLFIFIILPYVKVLFTGTNWIVGGSWDKAGKRTSFFSVPIDYKIGNNAEEPGDNYMLTREHL